MIIFVGLGNPDLKYQHTYHNIGFDVIDFLSKDLDIKIDKMKYKALVGDKILNNEKIMLVKPQTYMNNSGESLSLLKKKFSDARIIVVVDDIDLPKGTIRYREHGSAGTHNGLRSIVSYIGEDFERIKVGIGRDVTVDLVDYVLSKYNTNEFNPIIERVVKEIHQRFLV